MTPLGGGRRCRGWERAVRLARIGKVRGRGLMLGVEVGNAVPIVGKLLQRGILALPEGSRAEVVGLTPPLVITNGQLSHCLQVFSQIFL